MKWKIKGHEFDKRYSNINENITKKKIFLYGCGEKGNSLFNKMDKCEYKIEGFVDRKHDILKEFCKKKVISFSEYLSYNPDEVFLIVAVGGSNLAEVKLGLDKEGKIQGKDYLTDEDFIKKYWPIIELYEFDFLHLSYVQISLTERCTLKCKLCCHGCNMTDITDFNKDLQLDDAKKTIDSFFDTVDYVDCFDILGGEPLLYPHITQVIDYIGSTYRNKIDKLVITTNGTVIPKLEVIQLCKEYKVDFLISDYSISNSKFKSGIEKLIKILKSNVIGYQILFEDGGWIDFSLGVENKEKNVEENFNSCISECREIRHQFFYYCIMARSYSENAGMGIGEDDYCDLKMLDYDCEKSLKKKILFEYDKGYSSKGYLDMCKYCRGMTPDSDYVLVGEQEKNKAY